jgi:hypothetical protein
VNLFEDGKKKRKTREYPPDPIWDCVVKIWYPSGVAEPFRKQVNRFVQSLKDYGATPEEIHRAAKCYKKKYPTMAFTLQAVVKHWDQLREPPIPKPRRNEGIENEADDHQYQRAMKQWLAQGNEPSMEKRG